MDTIFTGLLIPFFGTSLGALAVFLMRQKSSWTIQRVMIGFASGVMIASSIFSLILPAMEISEGLTCSSFIPAVPGYWLGILFMLGIDRTVPHLHLHAEKPEGRKSSLSKTMMMVLSVTIHNIPEGMAVGAVLAAFQSGAVSRSAALALAAGIAVQNIPEGAIISIPLAEEGVSKGRSFFLGVLSGAAEPIAAVITLLFAREVGLILPLLLSFAAGAMMYVVVEELIPEMSDGEHSNSGTIAFAAGFSLMMVLDIVFA
jgi:ZIP family zinc transporter